MVKSMNTHSRQVLNSPLFRTLLRFMRLIAVHRLIGQSLSLDSERQQMCPYLRPAWWNSMKTYTAGQKGQSLVEMIVIIGMVVLLATGIVAGTTVSLSSSKTSQVRSQALSYAQAGIELARATRDDGWPAFSAMGNPPSTTVSNIDNTFTRSVTLELTTIGTPPTPTMKVTSQVTWGDTTNPLNKVELTTYLTQWR